MTSPDLAALVSCRELSLDDFARHRAALTGVHLDLAGLRALAAAEAGFADRLRTRILPALVRYGAAATHTPLPHREGESARTVIPRALAAGLVARIFLGNLGPRGHDLPVVDAAVLLATTAPQELAKLRCMLAYFDRIADEPPLGVLEIERIAGTGHAWERDGSPLAPVEVDATGSIEDADHHVHVDFANAYLGGGALIGGCVQEEIRFAVAPELLVGMIVSPRMGALEAIHLHGSERFSTTTGYAFSLGYGGSFHDPCARRADGTPDTTVAAIDAIDYRRGGASSQYSAVAIRRELDKARIGFRRDAATRPIATGNWGCGAFLGDPAQKAVIQWLAASAEGRAVRYFTFGDRRLGDLAGFIARATTQLRTVGAVAHRLLAMPGASPLYDRLLA
jgi:hypothetical protein